MAFDLRRLLGLVTHDPHANNAGNVQPANMPVQGAALNQQNMPVGDIQVPHNHPTALRQQLRGSLGQESQVTGGYPIQLQDPGIQPAQPLMQGGQFNPGLTLYQGGDLNYQNAPQPATFDDINQVRKIRF